MLQCVEEGGGNSSTLARGRPSYPPSITCPDSKNFDLLISLLYSDILMDIEFPKLDDEIGQKFDSHKIY